MRIISIFALTVLLAGAQPGATAPSGIPLAVADAAEPSDLSSALRVAQTAEIYRIPPDINFVAAPTPDVLRHGGCRYFLRRAHYLGDAPAWRELEHSLSEARINVLPSNRRTEVRIGIILSDWRGILWEVYSTDLGDNSGKVDGLEQRRMVKLPISFARALEGFIARHPELMDPMMAKGSNCPATGERR